MAKKIAIELEIGGVKQTINTINELETSIQQLTEELKGVQIGSQEFNKLTNELNKAKSELKTFEKAFEGLEPEQKTQAYVAFAESVVSGIFLAQEALRAFGVENENVNNAVEESTRAINLVLQGRIVIEGILQSKILVTELAQKALNLSVVQGNKVLKTLFTTIAANPVGALVVAIGLLVTAFIALSESADDSTKSLERNEAQQKANELRSARLSRELAKLNAETEKYIKSVNTFDFKTATDELARLEQAFANLETQQNRVRNLDYATIGNALANGTAQLDDYNLSIAEQEKLLNQVLESIGKYERSLPFIYGSNLEAQQANLQKLLPLQKQLEENIARGSEQAGNLSESIDAVNKRLQDLRKEASSRELTRFESIIEGVNKEFNKLNDSIIKFGETPSPKVIEDLEALLQKQIQLQQLFKESERTLGDVFTEYSTDVSKAVSETDDFGRTYERVRVDLSEAFKLGDDEGFSEALENARQIFFDAERGFNEEQRRAAGQLLSSYRGIYDQLIILGTRQPEDFEKIITPLLDGLANKLELSGDILFEKTKGATDRLNNEITTIGADVGGEGVSSIVGGAQNLVDEISISQEQLLAGTTQFYNKREELIARFTDSFLKQASFRKLAEEDEASAREAALQAATEAADTIIGQITTLAVAEDNIRGVLNQVEDLTLEIDKNKESIDTFLGLIIENFDDIKEQFDLTTLDPTATLEDNLSKLNEFFKSIGAEDILNQFNTEEEKTKILEFFLKKRQELIEEQAENEKNTAKETAKTQEEIFEETLGYFQQVLGSFNQLTAELGTASQIQIEGIERQRDQLLDTIVGDTEQAEALRVEITENAEREIVEIERKARLRELQFTKVQAIGDLAQALVNSFKLPPPFNAIQAGIITTAGGLQIANIQNQIDQLQSAQGFKEGGFVSGEGTGSSDSIPAFLSNGEFVINADATKRFRPLLEMLNNDTQKRFQNGGFVMNNGYIPSTNIQNIFDDSRIIKELKTLRNQPVRAYVFEKEITQAQQVEKRLQELSKL